ncbi:hypothetical protein LENED_006717 [Lentinula edodes]|uniref:Uncharacterized protein n=1 Tax=Lentinula edodes TaxID=5353 RepID=A0A1Q3ECI0_LENED|nr:hypothetical protein LENED_006717 [Lentinula edodes]
MPEQFQINIVAILERSAQKLCYMYIPRCYVYNSPIPSSEILRSALKLGIYDLQIQLYNIKFHGGFYILFRSTLGLLFIVHQCYYLYLSVNFPRLAVRLLRNLSRCGCIAEVFTKPELLVQVLNSTPSFCHIPRSRPTPHAQFAEGTRP